MPAEVAKLLVKDVMSTDVRTVARNDPLSVPEGIMKSNGFRHLPVLDEYGQLCGVLSGRDLFRGALLKSLGFGSRAEETLLETMVVKEAMSEQPIVTSPDTPLHKAAATLVKHGIGCLPVLQDNELVGVLTEGDFVRLLSR